MTKLIPTTDTDSLARAHKWLMISLAFAALVFLMRISVFPIISGAVNGMYDAKLPKEIFMGLQIFQDALDLVAAVSIGIPLRLSLLRLGAKTSVANFCFVLCLLIPIAGFIVAIKINGNVSTILRERGWKVGLFEATKSTSVETPSI